MVSISNACFKQNFNKSTFRRLDALKIAKQTLHYVTLHKVLLILHFHIQISFPRFFIFLLLHYVLYLFLFSFFFFVCLRNVYDSKI